ncbi:ATP-binding cassette domain-containing protein [Mycoplasma todarodis]|uniref:ATP-binding cassette domain-containing protein n=1 Tax=Mycoplasma todarodis TaxID=1937191 RepID=UPI003B395BE3
MKIISRGNEFEIDDSLMEPGKHTIIFGPNGSGKTCLASAFLHETDPNKFRINDLMGLVEPNIDSINKSKNQREIIELNTTQFNNILRNNGNILISKNASEIQKLTNIFNVNTTKINLAASVIRKELKEAGIDANIFKKYFKNRVGFISGVKPEHFSKWPNEQMKEVENKRKHFFTELEIAGIRKLIQEIQEYFDGLKSKVINIMEENSFKNKIQPHSLENYETLFILLKDNEGSFNIDGECPFCGAKCNYKNLINELKDAIQDVKKQGGEEFKKLKKQFDDSDIATDMLILWVDDGVNYPLDCTLEEFDSKFGGVQEEDYMKMLQSISPTLRETIDISHQLKKLDDDEPEITPEFLDEFNKLINQFYTLSTMDIGLSVENKKIKITTPSGELNEQILSTSMLKVFCFCYEYAYLKTLVDPIIIVDDPSDSNDIKNIKFLREKLGMLCTKLNTVIILTHDVQFIKEWEDE